MSVRDIIQAAAGAAGDEPVDPNFNQTVLLLHGDGTNGAQNNTFIDSSSNNFTITRNGNTTQGSFSPYGDRWSNYFANGNNDYLTAPANNAWMFGTGDFTVECWIYRTSATTNIGDFIACGNTSSNSWYFAIYQNKISAGTTGAFPFLSGSTNLNLNTWYHVVLSRSSGAVRLFVNGVLDGSTTNTTNYSAAPLLSIGSNRPLDGNWPYRGYISNLRVVKGTALYTSNFTPPTAPLTAVTNTVLLTCQSNRFIDNSSNNFAIARNGDVSVQRFSPFAPTAAYNPAVIGASGYFSSSYLSISNDLSVASSTDFTVEAWVNGSTFSNSSQGRCVLSIGNESSGRAQFTIDNGGVPRIELFGGAVNLLATDRPILTNTWNHVAWVRQSNVVRIYVNGVVSANTTTSSVVIGNSGSVFVGHRAGLPSTGDFPGYISNLRLVNGTALYTSNFTPPTAPLTNVTNTSLLLNFTNAGIFDNTALNVLETVGDAQISTSVKKFGSGSMAFDGTGDWLLSPHSADQFFGTGNFTIEMWVYINSSGTYGIVAKGASTTGWLVSVNSSNQVIFTFGSSTITSSATVSNATWTHIAVVREGTGTNQTKIYIGGSNSGTGTVNTDFTQTNPVYVGANRTGGNAYNGYIDDLRITKGVARYTANFTPPDAPFPDL